MNPSKNSYFYIPIPLNKEGVGPASPQETFSIVHEVWDENCLSVCRCDDDKMAKLIAQLLTTHKGE